MNPNLYSPGHERIPSYLFLSTGTAPVHPAYNDPRKPRVNPNEYRKYEKIQEQVQKKKAKETPPTSPTEAPILLFQAQTPQQAQTQTQTQTYQPKVPVSIPSPNPTSRYRNQHHLSPNQRLSPIQSAPSPRPFK
jgi:hypothetical protein